MTRERIGAAARYLLGALLLAVLTLADGTRWLWALTVFYLLVPVVSLAANMLVRRKIRGRILLPTTAAKGTACMGSVLLENRGWLPAAKLCCRIRLINDLTGEEHLLEQITGIGPKRDVRQDFLMESTCCGRVYVHVETAKLLDYFGLFTMKVPLKASARITILPELFSCEVTTGQMSAVSDDSIVSRRGDDRTEVFQLREYQSGDDIRQIHWKLSTKLDTLILREPSQSVSRSLLVFWDKRGDCSPAQMDAMAEVTASVCQALCDRGTAFDLCWTEKDELELRQIRDADTLLQTIPALVTQAGSPECMDPDLEDYGQAICITSAIPAEGDQRTNLICTDSEYEDSRSVVFNAENYRERLERLEI